MVETSVEVVAVEETAPQHWRLRLAAPAMAREAKPGQFLQIRCRPGNDPLLPRPFSIFRRDPDDGTVDILFRVVGAGTRLLSEARTGQQFVIWGPLGRGFTPPAAACHITVGGGVGIPPLYMLAAEQLQNGRWGTTDLSVLLGARTAHDVICAADFQSFGIGISVATDDGSWGHRGVVTDLLRMELEAAAGRFGTNQVCVYACGPNAMLAAVAAITVPSDVPCQVCMEAPMPCGIGVCMGCVVGVRDPATGDLAYRRVCREGPVFAAEEVVWKE